MHVVILEEMELLEEELKRWLEIGFRFIAKIVYWDFVTCDVQGHNVVWFIIK